MLPACPPEERDGWARAFVDAMGRLADRLAPRPLHEQRVPFHLVGASFRHALAEAERLRMDTYLAALVQALATYAQNTRDFAAAAALFSRLADAMARGGNWKTEASAYHQLGMVAQERRDFAAAEQWYLKSLAIFERLGISHHAASTYHQLGMVAEERRDFAAAEQWYRKALPIFERLGDEHGAASTYGQLGIVAGLRERYSETASWLVRCITTFAACDDPHGAERNTGNFLVVYRSAPPEERVKMRAIWEQAGLPDLPWPDDPA